MRGKWLSITLLILALILTGNIYAYGFGISNSQMEDYPGAVDYRQQNISENPFHSHPLAKFSLQIKSGSSISQPVESAGSDDEKTVIVSDFDLPVIKASAGDRIVINDLSRVGSGKTIIAYDIQYRFTPKGEKRENYEIKPAIVNSFKGVKDIIENLPLDRAGTYEIYMAVADYAECLPGAVNWSANGNVRVLSKNNPHFPQGVFWYFTSAAVEVEEGRPDFYPLPEGATEYKNEYKILAKTYTGKAGEVVEVKFTVNNSGEEGTTDVGVTWFGKGWGSPLMHEKGITLKKGESRDFSLAGHYTKKLFSSLPFHLSFI